MIYKLRLFLFFSFLYINVFNTNVIGQQNHFIYIQSEDKESFFAELNNKLYNSTDIGYLIIPKLQDGEYRVTIGFPQAKYPAQQFLCMVDKKDAGYALKNFAEKGWGLFNFQTSEIIMAGGGSKPLPEKEKIANPFGEMLSNVVDDSMLIKPDIIVSPEVKQIEIPATIDASISTADSSLKVNEKSTGNNIETSSGIIKASEKDVAAGIEMVFFDFSSLSIDTIKIVVPAIKTVNEGLMTDTAVSLLQSDKVISMPDTIVTISSDSVKSAVEANKISNPFFEKPGSFDTVVVSDLVNNSVVNTVPIANTADANLFKQDCIKMILDNEVDKLRRKLVSEPDNEQVLKLAKKYIGDKCITTSQVKSVLLLLSTDESRYNFLDLVYKNTYDYSNFPAFESQMIDPYYKKRFQALLR